MPSVYENEKEAAARGSRAIGWAEGHMRLLGELKRELEASRPFEGLTIGVCLHVEPKTAVMCRGLRAGGAKVVVTGSPGTTHDDVAAALRAEGAIVYGGRSDGLREHEANIARVLEAKPNLIVDNGADLAFGLAGSGKHSGFIGGTEETTTGANRLREELRDGIDFPVIVINDSPLKQIMENEHGVGQTVVEGFMRTTNLLLPGRRIVVIGYGSCGRGVSRYLRSMGSEVTVVERDPIAGLKAAMDGFKVAKLEDTLEYGQVFVTVTGRPGIIREEHLLNMRDGAILANAGHFSWEIDLQALRDRAIKRLSIGPYVEQFELNNGKKLALLTGGEMLNLAGGGGNPIETMDLGLSLQVSSLLCILRNRSALSAGPQPVPDAVNREVASGMLRLLSA